MAMVLFVVSMTALTSCTKSKEKLILGKWKLETITMNYGGQSVSLTTEAFAEMFDDEELKDVIVEFRDNGYAYFNGQGVPYTIDGDYITVTEEGQSMQMTIAELTSSKLLLEASVPMEENELSLGMVDVVLELSKL